MSRWLIGALLLGLGAGVVWQAPEIAAGGLLHPHRRASVGPTPGGCTDREFGGNGVTLRGWFCASQSARRATIVYLHGIADNRSSSTGVVARYLPRGFDVIAYDGRAHGESGGEFCTYGVHERRDLQAVIATVPAGPVILIGTSLGGAVALQTAAHEPRVSLVVGAEVFSDLETVARERAPRLLPEWAIVRAFRIAENRAGFAIADASPLAHGPRVVAPVLLIHGDRDVETSIEHSIRVLEALAGRRGLLTVPGAGHNQSLSGDVWVEVDRWIEHSIGGDPAWKAPSKHLLEVPPAPAVPGA